MTAHSAITDFMIRLHKIGKAGLVLRDPIVLYYIKHNPGTNGISMSRALGLGNRSTIQDNVKRLERLGMIEDRRAVKDFRHANILHITPAGEALLDDVLPK